MFKSKTLNTFLLIVVFIGCLAIIIGYGFKGGADQKVIGADFTNIDIDTKNATVHIVPTQASEATVSYSSRFNGMRKITLDAKVKGQTLNIELKDRGRLFIPFNLPFSKLTLTVSLPEQLYNELTIHNRNGKVNAKQIDAAFISVRSNNGTIHLEHVEGQVEARTNNGKIELVTDHLDRDISMRANNGKLSIRTNREPENAVIEARKNNGKIRVFGHNNQTTVFGDGKHVINLRTNNGSIDVSK